MSNQKGFVQILLIAGIIIVLAAMGYIFFMKKPSNNQISMPVPSAYQAQYNQGTASAPQVQNKSDLNKASSTLDSTDTAQIDSQLKALDSASAGF